MMGADIKVFIDEINTINYGYTKPFYWIQMPDGEANRMITRGKLLASLAVLRMNYPYLRFMQVGKLPEPKRKKK
jgi:hypothetical protein